MVAAGGGPSTPFAIHVRSSSTAAYQMVVKSEISKNEMVRERLKILVQRNRLKLKYILWDSWFSAKENMQLVKNKLDKDFVAAIKSNRLVALSEQDKRDGQFVAVSDLDMNVGECRLVYLKGLKFPLLLVKRVFTNKDGSTGTLYLVSSDTSKPSSQSLASNSAQRFCARGSPPVTQTYRVLCCATCSMIWSMRG